MKNKTKIKVGIIALFMLLVGVIFSLAGCGGGNVAADGTALIVIENRDGSFDEHEVDLSLLEHRDEGGLSLLEYLGGLQGGIVYSVNYGGGYGGYINSIGSLFPGAGEYVSLYTSEREDFAVPTEYMPTVSEVKYKEITLKYAGVGIADLSVKDGTVILMRVEAY